jgi:hypothetical protein
VLGSECAGLVSAVSYSDAQAQGPLLLLGKLELDWWVQGKCRCAQGANCTQFVAPTTGQEAFRCQCPEGLVGDGFVDGAGCKTGLYSLPPICLFFVFFSHYSLLLVDFASNPRRQRCVQRIGPFAVSVILFLRLGQWLPYQSMMETNHELVIP